MNKHLFLIVVLLTCRICNAQNLILNGGFETATVGLPLGTSLPNYPTMLNSWTAVNTDGEYIYDLTFAHSGTGFLSVLQNAGMSPATFWLGAPFLMSGYDRAMQIVPVSASTSYHLQFWVRSGNGLRYASYTSGNMLLQIEQVSPVNAIIDSLTVYTPLTWQQSTVSFTTGAACTSIAILFSPYGPGPIDAWIDDVDLHTESASGIHSIISEHGISVYPNPVSDQLTVSIDDHNLSEIILYDISSRKLLQQTFTNATTLNTAHLAKGIYIYEVRNKNNDVITKGKVVKE